MIRLFKSNQPLAVLLFPVLAMVMSGVFLMYQEIPQELDLGVWGNYPSPDIIWLTVISAVIVSFNAYLINNTFNSNDFLERNTYVVGFIYIVGCFTISIVDNPGVLLFHFFDILSIRQLFFVRQNDDAKRAIFNGALLLGIGLSFFPHAFPLLLFPFFTLIVIRPFVWREYALIFLAYVGVLAYIITYEHYYPSGNFIHHFWEQNSGFSWSLISLIQFSVWVLLLLVSFFVINKKIIRSGLRFKRLITLSWISVLLLIFSEFIHFLNIKEYVMISQVGTTFLVATGISLARVPAVYNILLYFLLLFAIYIQVGLKFF